MRSEKPKSLLEIAAMDTMPTGKQVEYATALGLVVTGSMTRRELSAEIDGANRSLGGQALPRQFSLAEKWGLLCPEVATRREMTDILYPFLVARRWVYSVARKESGAKWRHFEESGLPTAVVNRIAAQMSQDNAIFSQIDAQQSGTSETGDSWFRISANLIDKEAFRAAAHELRAAGIKFSPSPGNQTSAPKGAAKSRSTNAQVKGAGCSGMVLALLVAILTLLGEWILP